MPRILVVEDDFGSRVMMQRLLAEYGDTDAVVDGQEAVDAFSLALDEDHRYDLILMDIMMPKMDGQEALKRIRSIEKDHGMPPAQESIIIMTTALDDPTNVIEAYAKGGATSYIVKPIDRLKVRTTLTKAGFKPLVKTP